MATPTANWVGEQFISKYYDVLAKLPKHSHRFYKENSTFTVADVQPDGSVVVGTASGTLEDIQDKVMGTIANAVVASDMSLDAQFSQAGGVLLQVSGTMNMQGVDRKFVQVFFLATQEKGYYVLNDMLRIFPPEPARDIRPVENGFVAQHVPVMPAAPFGLAPPPLAGQLPPRVDMAPGMAPGLPVPPPPVVVQPLPAETEAAMPEQPPVCPAPALVPAAAPAPVAAPAPAAVPAPVVPAPTPAPVAPAVPPAPVSTQAPVPQPAPSAPAPKQAAPQQAAPAAPAGPSAAPAAPAPPANLSWAERARLASAAPPAPASVSKPPTPAKAPPAAAPSPVPEVPAAEGMAVPAAAPAVPSSDVDVPAEPQGDEEVESRATDVQEPVPAGAENDPGYGVYVQGIPQTGDLKKLLSGEFTQFGAFGPGGVNVICSPRFGMVAYIFYQDKKSRDAALAANGKLRLPESDKPVKILNMLPEFERGFAPRGGGRGERGRGSGMGSGYRGGRGGFDGSRGRGGRGEGGRGDRPIGGPGGRGGRGGDRGGRGGGSGRGPRDASSGPAGPKQA
ncbi:hypothetical protein PLESTB_001246200 [Pleodorina starrii]|uniref:NTF2 domain-containing protein n=1 Tax=Pleodorina starrii TaxID=330485 RepID=A0A9W6F613_9CHLO|nr:hypothetical protein PLESTB_001246200 [Pleodorina starrii]GLC63283.1 hypothetical protein PLESTF_000019900 [Pleodorina starrii]